MSSGKEAKVYWAKNRDGEDLAVKIYLTMTAEFRKGILKYIMGDRRFERIPLGDIRRLIYEWTRKEFRNLRKMYNNNVNVPKPIAYRGNVLVMQFIGENGVRAPLLHELDPSPAEAENYYKQILDNLARIVCAARLVHADLSEYNIMIWDDKVYIIDVSQAVSHDHPLAEEFLRRDLENLYRYFGRLGVIDDLWEETREKVISCLTGT